MYNSTFRLHDEELHLDRVTSELADTCCSDRISTGNYQFFLSHFLSEYNLFYVLLYIIFLQHISSTSTHLNDNMKKLVCEFVV